MQNKKTTLLIILSIGALVSLIYGITSQPRTKRAAPLSSKVVSADSAGRIMPMRRRAKKTDFITWGRNPFSLKGALKPTSLKLILSGIIWDEKEPKALINNIVVGIGDKIYENTIVDIKRDRVFLNDGTEDFTLTLEEQK